MPQSGDKTYQALTEWFGSSKDSERMCAQLASIEGFVALDPSHPLGGPDGKQDALVLLDGERKMMAVSFSREKLSFQRLRKKFVGDCKGIQRV